MTGRQIFQQQQHNKYIKLYKSPPTKSLLIWTHLPIWSYPKYLYQRCDDAFAWLTLARQVREATEQLSQMRSEVLGGMGSLGKLIQDP